MATRFAIVSSLLAACYAEPDIELTVTRPTTNWIFSVMICKDDGLTACNGGEQPFEVPKYQAELTLLTTIFVDDASTSVGLRLSSTSYSPAYCELVAVTLQPSKVQASIDLRMGALPDAVTFSCDNPACAPPVTCPPFP